MNITKALAEEVATKMVLPITEKINALIKERVSIADEAISKSIPKEIADCYSRYKKYFQTAHCVTLHDGSHEVRIDDTSISLLLQIGILMSVQMLLLLSR